MASGVEAITGLIAFSFTLFTGCLKGFAILRRARECDRHVGSIRLMLELEQHKLLTWADEVGLLETPPQLRVGVPEVSFVNAILRKLGELLEDVQSLRYKYGLRIESTSEEIVTIDEDDSSLGLLAIPNPSELQRWQQATLQVFRTRTQPWRRLKWVTVDEQHFRGLLRDISYFTNELYHFLEHGKRQSVEVKHNTLLRSTIINTTSQLALDVISHGAESTHASSAVAATARLKKKRLRLGLLDLFRPGANGNVSPTFSRSPTLVSRELAYMDIASAPKMDSRRLSARLLTLSQIPKPSEYRQMAYYEGQPILLEWRPILPGTWSKVKDRVERLSSLLSELDDPSFHSLPCRGYVVNKEVGRYGFVFSIPRISASDDEASALPSNYRNCLPRLPGMETLQDLLANQRPIPSLNTRINCAIILLETVLQLHTAGWFHKELRPNNIVLLGEDEDGSNGEAVSDVASMYVAGYVYARSDDPQELTEPSEQAIEAQLYRHPLSLGTARQRYCKGFDLFSVGCLLLEIGLWMCFSKALLSSMTADSSIVLSNNIDSYSSAEAARSNRRPENSPRLMILRRQMLQSMEKDSKSGGEIFRRLEAQVGRQYTRVTLDCLKAFSSTQNEMHHLDITEDGPILELEERSLKTLKDLADRL